MSVQDELDRQRIINVKLRRQLERCRQDTVEYCAKLCEDNEVSFSYGTLHIDPATEGRSYTHPGDSYAKALRGIIGGPVSGK